MKFKIDKTIGTIYTIVFVVFTVLMMLLWEEKEFVFWCFYICSVIICGNLLFIHGYTAGSNKNATTINQSLFVVPVVTYIVFCLWTWLGTVVLECETELFLAIIIVIFSGSIILQMCMFKARTYNIKQEDKMVEKRWERDELIAQWKRISGQAVAKKYQKAEIYAAKLKDSITYADPMSEEQLKSIENEIFQGTKSVLDMLAENVEEEKVIKLMSQISDWVDERNDKCRSLKGNM